jgi:4-hydroxybenzoate polyprenyltransferase
LRLTEDVRASEWWDHKLAPILATAYATACVLHERLLPAAPDLALALLALACGGAYVSLLNDVTDVEVDRAAGKRNRAAGRRARTLGLLAASIGAGWAIVLLRWHDDQRLLIFYAGAWLAFTLYSLPPIRLKARGLPGALADGAGAHLFPHLFVAAVVFARSEPSGHQAWFVLVGVWAAALGLRGALVHQLRDLAADRAAGVATFAARHPRGAQRVGAFVAFPVEAAAFCALAIYGHNAIMGAAAAVYLIVERARTARWGAALLVVGPPRPDRDYRFILFELYESLYPLSYLALAALRAPADAVVLVAHVVLFRRVPARFFHDVRDEFYMLRLRLSPRLVKGLPRASGADQP